MGQPLSDSELASLILYTHCSFFQEFTKMALNVNKNKNINNNSSKNNNQEKTEGEKQMTIMDYCMYMAITKLNLLNKTKKETGQTTWIPLLCSGHRNVFWDKKSRNDNGEIEFYKYTSFTWLPNICAQYCKIDDKNVNSVVLILNDLKNVVWADVSWLSKHQREMEVIVRRNCRTFCKAVIQHKTRKFEIVLLGKKCQNCQFRERIEYENCDKCHVSDVKCKNCNYCLNCAWSWMT